MRRGIIILLFSACSTTTITPDKDLEICKLNNRILEKKLDECKKEKEPVEGGDLSGTLIRWYRN